MHNIGFSPSDILLPSKGTDISKWAVVACDQFTSDRSYWEKADRIVGDSPSTLRITLPEAFLEDSDKEERIDSINRTMNEYLESGIFECHPSSYVLVERSTASGTRYGLVGMFDLEEYDFSPDSKSLIRATEGTILSRIPPRKEIRKNAKLELPHIVVLISDSRRSVIEPLRDRKESFPVAYDADLMLGGGHIRGYVISGESDKKAIHEAFEELYSSLDPANPLLFAMGDGNHSLATAKSIWEDRKKEIPESEWAADPARYALAEVENIYDEGLQFEPIHRAFFGLDKATFDRTLSAFADIEAEEISKEEMHSFINEAQGRFALYDGEKLYGYRTSNTEKALSAWTIQSVIDKLLEGNECQVDYIHGTEETLSLAGNGNLALILPDISKETFFSSIISDKAFPRKTFSIGHAEEKRYYMEARKIR